MLQQMQLNFKLGITKEKITPRSGIAIYAQVLKSLGIDSLVDKYMPLPGSNRGYNSSSYIIPLMLLLFGGGRHIEDLKELINDKTIAELTGIKIPSPSTFGDWLRRLGRTGLNELKRVIYEINKTALSLDKNTEYTLFIDPTMIEANKFDAAKTYMGFKGYRPIIATLNEIPIILFHEFKDGNVSGADVKVLEDIFNLMPKNKRIKHVSIDSEFYSSDVIDFLTRMGVTFTISADKTASMKETIKRIDNWAEFKTVDGVMTDRLIGENIYCMEKSDPFRIVVLKWIKKEADLFEQDSYCYHVIATNQDTPKEEVIYEYNKRVSIENVIKELKIGFGMEDIPTGDYFANGLFFAIGVLVYNTTVIIKLHLLPEDYRTKTIETIRWSLINIAGKVINHGRRVVLLLASTIDKLLLYKRMRDNCAIFA